MNAVLRQKLREFLEPLEGRAKISTNQHKNELQRGMTLIEIMVVVVIISLVAGFVGVEVFGRLKEAEIRSAGVQIKTLGDALDQYRLDHRKYPSTGEGLQAIVAPKGGREPYMKEIPSDPWGQDYVYISPGTHNSGTYDLMSYGPDREQGGGDDIGNWKTSE